MTNEEILMLAIEHSDMGYEEVEVFLRNHFELKLQELLQDVRATLEEDGE